MTDEIRPALTPEQWKNVQASSLAHLVELRAPNVQDQSFGFTWEMVDRIEDAASTLEKQGWDAEHLQSMRDAAARIAALLPPRTMEEA